ncbi:hypothetical protein H4N54_18045 [Limnospira fusiformis KN01]|uniref:DUF2281 domain-containing protein n=2 Tax=Limnospira TaxID=2596745 RepID=A0A9P1NXA2_9CYAN|nr:MULTISPECIES: hypothetical protein [Limnospira]MDT9180248.1 hypothetical protein [Limnospira sp. PMC 1238.20]MDT9188350.1 hypothetical protein [Limnospira sp. PMC 894.15]MDT9200696.1 hypothetical protein [Limnospira sp. PMC 1042.18]MDT9228593.1 hypothetical protein [Limnospira sp. PMC 1242.20]MDT9234108.1 hypothetical protein [Limnospira sp. PMC 917.15]
MSKRGDRERLADRLLKQLATLAPDDLDLVIDFVSLLHQRKHSSLGKRLRDLFRETQALPGVSQITEEDIAAEIEAYRRGE